MKSSEETKTSITDYSTEKMRKKHWTTNANVQRQKPSRRELVMPTLAVMNNDVEESDGRRCKPLSLEKTI